LFATAARTIVFTTVDTKFIIHSCHSPIEFAVVAS